MDLTIDNIILILTTLGGLAGAIFTQRKYQAAKENLVEIIGDVANLLTVIYEISKSGTCTPDQMQMISKKVEEIWTGLQNIGPTFADLLKEKTELAIAVSKTK